MPVANEIIPAEDVAAAVAEAYDRSVTATLVRRGFNDTYAIDGPDGQAVARVYLAGKYYLRDDGDIVYELELLRHLAAEGVSVSTPQPRADGELLGRIVDAVGVSRPLALFSWADGEPVQGSTDQPEVARGYGQLLGSIHAASSSFRSEHSRYQLDGEYLLEQPVRLIRQCLGAEEPELFAPYRAMVEEMREFLAAQPLEAPVFGYVHGDPHGRNLHVDATGHLTAFDFDHGGFGWRAYDVATAGAGVPSDLHEEFLAGYRSAHPLPHDAAELHRWLPLRSLWDVGDWMAMAPAMGKTVAMSPSECLRFLEPVAAQWSRFRP